MDYKYNFSFIIPHKNLPDLLERCINSIPKRDDVQIIIVDDNSDSSIVDFERLSFCKSKNIEIILDTSGKRQGHARNLGIEKAQGKWLIFADSDDFFFHSINKALDENVDNDADIVYFKATLLDSDTYLPCKNQNCIPNVSVDKFLNGDKFGEHFVRYRYPAPWGKFFKSSLVRKHNIRFAEIERLEDAQFSYQCGHYAKKIDVKDYSLYCYVRRENTVTTQISEKSYFTVVKVCADCMRFLDDNNLAESPTYRIMTDILFDHLLKMKKEKNPYFSQSVRYLIQLNFPENYIDKKIRETNIRQFKGVLFSYVRNFLRHK